MNQLNGKTGSKNLHTVTEKKQYCMKYRNGQCPIRQQKQLLFLQGRKKLHFNLYQSSFIPLSVIYTLRFTLMELKIPSPKNSQTKVLTDGAVVLPLGNFAPSPQRTFGNVRRHFLSS